MSVQKLRQQFSQDDPGAKPNPQVIHTQIPVAKFSPGQRAQSQPPMASPSPSQFNRPNNQPTDNPSTGPKRFQPPAPYVPPKTNFNCFNGKSSFGFNGSPATKTPGSNFNCTSEPKTPVANQSFIGAYTLKTTVANQNFNGTSSPKTPVANQNFNGASAPKTPVANQNFNGTSTPKMPVANQSFVCASAPKTPVVNENFNSPASSWINSSASPAPKFSSTLSFAPRSGQTSPTSPVNGFPQGTSPDRWRTKYDEAEAKRKTLLQQNQRLARDNDELQRKIAATDRDKEAALRGLKDKEAQLNHLRKLSEGVYREYDQLKNQYELETGSMQKAMAQASEWYKQNRVLKRRSTALMQRVMEVDPNRLSAEFADDTDSGVSGTEGDDLDDLRKNIQDLHKDVARLQAELNSCRLQEFEAQETIVDLTSQLEEEKNNKALLQSELKELRGMKENLGQVSRLVASEVSSLREQYEKEKETAQRMKLEADNAKKERNVLAHQSQMLMFEVAGDDRIMQLLMEVESLKRTLEEERQMYNSQIQALQEKLEDKEGDGELEMAVEKLKLAESELQCSLERAQRAETHSNQLASKVSALEEELEKKSQGPPPPPPPPLPPPPPPPPLPARGPSLPPRRSIGDAPESNGNGSALKEIVELLGIPKKQMSPTPPGGAIHDIINQLKEGKFTLKTTEPKPKATAVEEKPPVVQEMINVLGTLRRKRMSSGAVLDDKQIKH